MIRFPAVSFGYGARFGFACILEENMHGHHTGLQPRCAGILTSLPEIKLFHKIAEASGTGFLVIPPCSPYSHFASGLWSSPIPILAIDAPQLLREHQAILADFDNGLLYVSESESETAELRGLERKRAESPQKLSRSHHRFSILAEVNTASDAVQALADGADGFSVIKAEQLFEDGGVKVSDARALANHMETAPRKLPFLLRFFDPDPEGKFAYGSQLSPRGYLGFRGVRILEIDDLWLQRFVDGLEALALEQLVIVLPMISSVSEVLRFRERIGDRKWTRFGVTVETPAAALKIKDIVPIVDFVEIGLNDLTQYTMAWDRDVPNNERAPADRIVEPVADLVAFVAEACVSSDVPYTLGIDLRPSASLANQIGQLGISSISCVPPLIKHWRDISTPSSG